MRHNPGIPIAVAAGAAAIGITGAVLLDSTAGAVILLLVALAVVAGCVLTLRRRDDYSAVAALVAVPVVTLAVGVPAAVLGTGDDPAPRPARAAPAGDLPITDDDPIPTDLSSLLSAALDRADALVPDGSDSVLSVELGTGGAVSVTVLDRRDGYEVRSSRDASESRWRDADRGLADRRNVFARAELAGLDLTELAPRVREAAAPLLTERSAGRSGVVEIARRSSDDLLVASFLLSGVTVQVGADGQIAPTIAAATLEGMRPVARAAIVEAGLDPARAELGELQYRAVADGSDSVGATTIMNSGGIEMRFSAGQPVDRIVVVPGQFPDIDRSPATAEPGFRFSAVNTSVLLKVRADIMRRAGSPPYDAALVGLAVGQAPFDRELGPVIRMNVGPSSVKTAGMYTLRGRWVADRSF